jgi:hypothetical protein
MTHCLIFINDRYRTFAGSLTFAIGDSALSKIVRGQLDRNAIAGDDTDEMLPHLTGDMSYDLMAVLEFDAKLSTREGLCYRACQLNYFLTRSHKYNKGKVYQ